MTSSLHLQRRRRVESSSSEDIEDVISPVKLPLEDPNEDSVDSVSDLDCEPLRMSDGDMEADEGGQVTQMLAATDTEDDAAADAETPGIFQIPAAQRVAPNKAIWSRTPVQRSVPRQQTPPYTKGLASDEARAARTPVDFLCLLMDDDMLNEIVRCTNIQIARKAPAYGRGTPNIDQTSIIELKALLGLLIHAGANQDNHLTVEEMFSPRHGAPIII